jgi:Flp pilus assembly protein TadG
VYVLNKITTPRRKTLSLWNEMFNGGLRALRRLRREERGAALFTTTVIIVPLLMVTAVAIDFSQVLVVKRQLAGAVDSAALTIAAIPGLDDTAAQAKAEAFVHAHYPEQIGNLVSVTVSRSGHTVDVNATAQVPMTFLRIAGMNTANVAVAAQALRKESKVEVVMALDNTGSMAGSKITALKSAANTLVDTLMGASATSDYVKIGLVPFTSAVNVGSGKRSASWMDEAHPAALNWENLKGTGGSFTNHSLFELYDAMHARNSSISWPGCVRARTEPYDTTDQEPSTSNTATLFTPLLPPDEKSGMYNNYIYNSCNSAIRDNMIDVTKYNSCTASTSGPSSYCTIAAIQPLTNVKATITTAISAMTANGNTVVPEGLAWGWRAISPTEPFTEGVDYNHTDGSGVLDTTKAIILMTDGENDISQDSNSPVNSIYSSFGYKYICNNADCSNKTLSPHLGSNPSSTLNSKLTTLCNNIKALKKSDGHDAIIIYTILFQQNNATIKNIMTNCATQGSECPSNSCFFNSPSSNDLKLAFEEIAAGLNNLRVSK